MQNAFAFGINQKHVGNVFKYFCNFCIKTKKIALMSKKTHF